MTSSSFLGRAAAAVLDFIYPPSCKICGRRGVWLCGSCAAALPAADGQRCPRCWLPLGDEDCRNCAEYPPVFSSLRSPFRYEGDARRLVVGLKYSGESVLAPPMGQLMAERFEAELAGIDMIVPVPLVGSRQRNRGFNQAERLASAVGLVLDRPVVAALKRLHSTSTQARSASAEERRSNVTDAFAVRDAVSVEGARVLIIDDVATTGATLDACALPLREAGAEDVQALTFARED